MKHPPLTRRQALWLAAAGPLSGAAAHAPRLAAQVYVWTQQFRARNITLADGLEEVFEGTRQAGFRRLELMSIFFQPELRERTLALAKKNALEVAIVYHGGPMHEAAAAEKTVADTLELAGLARRAGARWINVNPTPKPKRERKSDEELEVQARFVRRLAAGLKRMGIETMLHHHDPEMAEEAREWRHLLRNTDVSFCVDTHWVLRGGQDPLAILREAGGRLASLHLRNSQGGVWSEALGDGDVDYRKVAEHLRAMQYSGYLVVELAQEKDTKITRPLAENLRLSRLYAEKIFGLSEG